MHIFVLNFAKLGDFIPFRCWTGFAFDTEISDAYAEYYLPVVDTCERVPLFYFLQTDRYKIMFARTCFTFWEQVFTYASCRAILDQVLLLTVESAVDLRNCLRWVKPNVSCLWPVNIAYHLKVPFALRAVVFCACELLKLVCIVFCMFESEREFDFRLISNERTKKMVISIFF